MLLAEFLDAVAPAARRDAGGEARLDACRVHRDRGAEAVAVDANALRIDLWPVHQEFERRARVLDLLEADDAAARALALAAAAEIEAQRHVAQARVEIGGDAHAFAVLAAAEAVHDEKGGPALAFAVVGGKVEQPGELQPGR